MELVEVFGRSIAWACRSAGVGRSTFAYSAKFPDRDTELKTAMHELVHRFKRWGCPRIHDRLKKQGVVVNHKRTERIYVEEKLQVRARKRKKRARLPRIVRPKATRPNDVWSMDFVHDWMATKRKLKTLTIIDDCTKESVGIHVEHSISGSEVARFLDSLGVLPKRIRTDNGPEFTSNAFLNWSDGRIEHELITPGKPNENAYIESFNSRFRDECLNEHIFMDLRDAKRKIEEWRKCYNEEHPHSSLGMRTPKEFALEYEKMISG